MSKIRRSIGVLAGLLAVFAAVVALTTRAADQRAAAGSTTPAAQAAGTPQVPEESASVRDDPTIAPDAKQSADNNVSFPNDI